MKKFWHLITRSTREAFRSIWSTRHRAHLPERTAAAVARYDDMSEVLVKLIQFTIFAFFGLLYAASPVPNPDTVSLFPLVITVYLVFTFFSLILALLRVLPNWLIYLSIAIDIGLLTYLIYSFHIQYGQEPSFSLKDPAILNYFVLIGLRALRFDARYVLAAGAMSIFCWTALVIYVITVDPDNTMITRDYITYLTSNSVLIGAEIGKLVSLAIFTLVLAVSVRRAHTFLVTSVAEERAAHDLARFMPDKVAETIRASDHEIKAGEGTRREAAVLNVDIRNFTRMVADMDPGDAMNLLSRYQHEVVPQIHQHGGVVDKFMGDGIMATFGATVPDDKFCANALECVDAILAAVAAIKGPGGNLEINAAVVAGPVIFGAVGDGNRLEYTVIGSAVNMSAKLEKRNKITGTRALCDRKTYEKARAQGYARKLEEAPQTVHIDDKAGEIEAMVIA